MKWKDEPLQGVAPCKVTITTPKLHNKSIVALQAFATACTQHNTGTQEQCIYMYCSQMDNEAIKDVGEKGHPVVKVQLLNCL